MADGNLARALDRADQEIDAFIEKRHREREAANRSAQMWLESEEKYKASKRFDVLAQWSDYFLHQADVHERIAEENRRRAERLFADTGGG